MRKWKWVGTSLVIAVVATAAFAARGVVTTKQGQVFEGDVVEEAEYVSVHRTGIRSRISLRDVAAIRYTLAPAEEIRNELTALDRDDVEGRIALSRKAFRAREYELARTIAIQALAIEPNSTEANDLMDLIRRQSLMENRTVAKPKPVAGGRTVGGNGQPGTGLPVILMDEQDMNAVRQAELQGLDAGHVRVRFNNDVRRRYVSRPQVDPREFAQLTAFQQAQVLIRERDPQLSKDVVILDEPTGIRGYRQVQRYIIAGCATAQCHGSLMAGNFVLYPMDDPASMYTNFHLLMKYSSAPEVFDNRDTIFGGESVQMRMIDRQDPAKSLLLQYGLPERFSDNPHPRVPGFRAPFSDRRDAVYNRVRNWIENELRPVDTVHQVSYLSPIERMLEPLPNADAPTTQPAEDGDEPRRTN